MTTRDFTMIADEELKAQAEKLYNSGFKVEVVNSQSVMVSLNKSLSVFEVWDATGSDKLQYCGIKKNVLMLTLAESNRLGLG